MGFTISTTYLPHKNVAGFSKLLFIKCLETFRRGFPMVDESAWVIVQFTYLERNKHLGEKTGQKKDNIKHILKIVTNSGKN